MLEALGRWVPGFDPATGILVLPPWAAAVGAVLLVLVGLFVLTRCLLALARYLPTFTHYLRSFRTQFRRIGSIGAVVRVALELFGAALRRLILDGWSRR